MEMIEPLQVLRAIAAILVLLFHINGLLQTRVGHSQFFGIFSSSYVGVDLFFVLSGFIIYYSSYNKQGIESAKEFLLKRFLRIFPIYWVATIATLFLFIVSKYTSMIPPQAGYLSNAIEAGGYKMILMSFFLIPTPSPILAVAWTLSLELAFYLLFGMSFFRKPALFLFIFICWVAFCYLNLFIFHIDSNPNIAHPFNAFLNPIIIEFLFGSCVAILISRGYAKYSITALFAGIFWFIFSAVSLKYNREIMFGLPAALILYGMIPLKIKFPALLKFIGDSSYSIYLFHFPLLGVLMKILIALKLTLHMNSTLIGSLLFFTLISLCCAIYYYLENPMLAFCKKKFNFKANAIPPIPVNSGLCHNQT